MESKTAAEMGVLSKRRYRWMISPPFPLRQVGVIIEPDAPACVQHVPLEQVSAHTQTQTHTHTHFDIGFQSDSIATMGRMAVEQHGEKSVQL